MSARRLLCLLGLLAFTGGAGCGAEPATDVSAPDAGAIRFTATSPKLERRDRSAEKDDLLILRRAVELLRDDAVWNSEDDRVCVDDEQAGRRSLFCALHQASLDVRGAYDHRRVAL